MPTGIALALPDGLRRVRAAPQRAGAAPRRHLPQHAGLIDAGYRDELKVLLVNLDPTEPYKVQRGDRIAQLVVQQVEQAAFREVEELPCRERGLGGFGHSGR